MTIEPGTPEWFAQVEEEVLDPEQAIVDPHHHLWPPDGVLAYGLAELHDDTASGHRITGTVFIECGAGYRVDGPEHLKAVGETEFVASQAVLSQSAAQADSSGSSPEIKGIVAHADLRLGDLLDEVLDQHAAAGGERFKGIRHAGAHDDHPEALMIPGGGGAGLYLNPDFQAGVRRLGERGLTYDTWHYHHQNRDFATLAAAAPDTTLILDHFGTPLGVGRFEGKRDEIFKQWQDDISAIAEHGNVVAKLGGMAMPDNGFGWHTAARPPSSEEFVDAQARFYHHTIEAFGPERCMFESNFPVDRFSLSYGVLWNGLKKIAADYTPAERQLMFHDTASRIYQL